MPTYDEQKQIKKQKITPSEVKDFGKGVEASYNRHSLFQYSGMPFNGNNLSKDAYLLENWANVSSPGSKNPTAKNIINNLSAFTASTFTAEDFMSARYYGKIPNNQLITLRRFAIPHADNLFENSAQDEDGDWHNTETPDMARAVTWISEATNNKLSEILNFGVGFNWGEVEGVSQTLDATGGSMADSGIGQIDSGFFQSMLTAGQGLNPAQTANLKNFEGSDPLAETYPNFIHGPLNVIHKVLMQERGLKYEQEFTLNFYYDLRAIDGANPKLNFLDLFSNLLILTYNTAPFWGGESRMKPNFRAGKPLGDYNALIEGDYKKFTETAFQDMKTMIDTLTSEEDGTQPEGWLSWFKKAGNALSKITSNTLGSFFMKTIAGKQNHQVVKALLSGDPVGQWHLTIGNPLNPVAMIGNLVLEDAKFEFEGPLGFDDFPSGLKMTVTLKPGRARDKSEIESMFNCGRGRLYYDPEKPREGSPSVDFLSSGYEGNKASVYGTNPETDGLLSGKFPAMNEDLKMQYKHMNAGMSNEYNANHALKNHVINSINH